MLLPKRVKYRRVHRGRMTGKAMRGNTVSQGDYGIGYGKRRGRRIFPKGFRLASPQHRLFAGTGGLRR